MSPFDLRKQIADLIELVDQLIKQLNAAHAERQALKAQLAELEAQTRQSQGR